jgi:Flp pilus assembly CpaF family ATPase
MNKEILLYIVGAIFGSNMLLELVKSRLYMKKNNAETASTKNSADQKIIEMYQSLVNDLKSEVDRVKVELMDVRKTESMWVERYNGLAQSNLKLLLRVEELEQKLKPN